MAWKKTARSRTVQNTICAVLSVAIGLRVCLPVLQRQTAEPENPILQAQVQDITVLQAGEAETSYAGMLGTGTKSGEGSENGESTGESGEISLENSDPQQDISQEQQEENTESEAEPNGERTETDTSAAPSDTPSETQNDAPTENGTTVDTPDGEGTGSNGETGWQEDTTGDEGGEAQPLDIGLLMTWLKYGTEEKTVICRSGETVKKKILTAQLRNDQLRYTFGLIGDDADGAVITSVTCAEGNGVPDEVGESGRFTVSAPADPGYRNYTFFVTAERETVNSEGERILQELEFTVVIRCESGRDLELELAWQKQDGRSGGLICAADGSAAVEIRGAELDRGVFSYTASLRGQLAPGSRLVSAEYRTASGEHGSLTPSGGTLEMKTPANSDKETYYLTFTAVMVQEAEDESVEETVTYTVTIVYQNTADLHLVFTWFEKGITRRELTCDLNGSAADRVKTNQLSAGALLYEMALTGNDAKNARIKAISLQNGITSAAVSESGSVPMSVPSGEASATYVFIVTVEVNQKTAAFTVSLRLSGDLSLQMAYTITEEGRSIPQQILCENNRTVTADTVYDDQLTDGVLSYTFTILGEDTGGVEITDVKCYQSGSMRAERLSSFGTVKLLLDGKTTGENSFTVTAADAEGQTYTFRINVPYKHRGENLVKIAINLTDGMEVTNGESVNLTVRAWTEDETGKKISTIRATGSDTILTVTLDGEEIHYISSSGASQEYTLEPENPEVGDRNEHTLHIYAQDEFGNYGELEITLIGCRSQEGQVIGTAKVYVDLTVLGLGVYGPVKYTVLFGESVAYTAAKVLWGEDFGDPFGAADDTFRYAGGRIGSGTYDDSFYLASIYTGGSTGAEALSGRSWKEFGSTEEEILAYIDDYFGEGDPLAILWRCIYRNGLNLSSQTRGEIGEFDFTSGSGWMYSVGSDTYYPGQAMSDYYLSDGDTLTFRYTLAQGWDVGGGTDNYGYTVGYCVSAVNGRITVSHEMEEMIDPATGGSTYVCRCCGTVEACDHKDAVIRDLQNGTHRAYCNLCREFFGEITEHIWRADELTDSHICEECAFSEAHDWRLLEDTATCMAPGIKTEECLVCKALQEQESPLAEHTTDDTWYYTDEGHYTKCSVCSEEMNHGSHTFLFDGVDDWVCTECSAGHNWDLGHAVEYIDGDCMSSTYHCDICDINLEGPGDGLSHSFEHGWCTVAGCGEPDPNYRDDDEDEDSGGGDPDTDPPESDPDDSHGSDTPDDGNTPVETPE